MPVPMSQTTDRKKTTPVSIRVIETGKTYADLDDLPPEELDARLDSIQLGFEKFPEDLVGKSGVGWFRTMVKKRKFLIQAMPDGGHSLGKHANLPLPKTMDEVAARELLRAGGVWAVVAPRAQKTTAGAIRVRPDRCVQAFELRKGKLAPIALAAEQPIQLLGFRLHPETQAQSILDIFGGRFSPLIPDALSVIVARDRERLGPALSAAGPGKEKYVRYSAGVTTSMRRTVGWATSDHQTGSRKTIGVAVATPPRKTAVADITSAIVRVPLSLPPIPQSVAWLVAQLAEITGEQGELPPYTSAAIGDIYRAGASKLFYYAETEGPDSEIVRRLLDRARLWVANAEARTDLQRRVDANTAKALRYLGIVEDKFGEIRMKQVEAAGGSSNPEAVLKALSKREREIVALEYKSQEKEFEASLNNKCPHVGLVDRLRAATNSRSVRHLLRELAPYYKNAPTKKSERWIECRSCGFRIICPHVNELLHLQIRSAPFTEITSAMTRYAMRHGSSGGFHKYFCRICGELTGEVSPTKADRRLRNTGIVGNLNSYLRRAVWGETLRAIDQVVFPTPVDPRLFARTAADLVYPLLVEAEKTFSRATRNQIQVESMGDDENEEEISPIMRLYVSLFVYAYIFNLIRSSHSSKVPKKSRIGFEGVPPGAKLSRVAEQILRTIQKRKAGVLSRIEDISPEIIASRFRQAYQAVQGNFGDQKLTGGNTAMDAANFIVGLSPIYYYAAIAARVYGKVPPGRLTSPQLAKREYEVAMGTSFPKTLNTRAVIKGSKLAQLLLGIRFTGAGERRVPPEFPPGADPLYVYNDPKINLFQTMLRPPKKVDTKAFDKFRVVAESRVGLTFGRTGPVLSYPLMAGGVETKEEPVSGGRDVKKRLRLLRHIPGYNSDGLFHECYRVFVHYTTNVTNASAMVKYSKELKTVRMREEGFMLMRGVAATRPFRSAAMPPFKPHPKPVSITHLYDENGFEHTWVGHQSKKTIYIYSNKSEYTQEQLAKQIKKLAAEGKPTGVLTGLHLVNEKCGICGVLQTETDTLDLAKVSGALTATTEKLSFFVFYETRCPKGDLHEFVEAKCRKCGLGAGLSFQDNKKASGAYYKKYAGVFREQKAEVRRLVVHPKKAEAIPETALKRWGAFVKKWKPDYGVLVQAAELAGRPVVAMETIGATEGRLYPDVLAGKDAPSPPVDRSDPRLAAAGAAVRLFVQRWNRLRNVVRLGKASPLIALVLGDVPPHEYENLPKILPDVSDNYTEKQTAMAEVRSPADVLLFSIEQLGRSALQAASVKTPKWAHDLAHKYSKALLNLILRSESLLSKNGPFDFGIFGADDDKEADFTDPEAADEDVGEDDETGFSLEGSDIRAANPNLE
jgi:hypothetical protein